MRHWFSVLLAVYAVGAIALSSTYSPEVQQRTIIWFTVLIVIVSVPYFQMIRTKFPAISWKYAAAVMFVAHLVTPSVLQTDHFRYIWDGIQGIRFDNPFLAAPNTYPEFALNPWMAQINHPNLRTIYPPVAQVFFAVSTLFNPWLWHQAFGIDIGMDPTSLWQVAFGWKVIVGLCSVFLCYLYRQHNFRLLFGHPLYLTTIIGNGHVDIVYVMFLMTALHPAVQKKILYPAFLLAAAILAKWLPLMYLPLFSVQWMKKHSQKDAVSGLLICLSLVLIVVALFNWRTDNGVFESLGVYLDQWYFLGYVHQLLMPMIRYCCNYWGAAEWARNVSAGMFVVWSVGVFLFFWRQKLTLRLACLLLFYGFLVFNPTLHPWYFTALVFFALPYSQVFVTPWLWPLLTQYSVLFYYNNQDPVIVRCLVYSIVTIFLVVDGRKLRVRLKKLA